MRHLQTSKITTLNIPLRSNKTEGNNLEHDKPRRYNNYNSNNTNNNTTYNTKREVALVYSMTLESFRKMRRSFNISKKRAGPNLDPYTNSW